MVSSARLPRRLASLLLCVFPPIAANAAILVTQTDKGYQFSEAVALSVNGKDKVLSLGSDPKAVPEGKMPSQKLDQPVFHDSAKGFFAMNSGGVPDYIVPEGLPKGTQPDATSSWASSRIAVKTPDKSQTEVAASQFVAYLPDDLPSLVNFARSERDVRLIDSSDKNFQTQLTLIAAVQRAYPKDPATNALAKYVESGMRSGYESFQNGSANMDVLNKSMQFAELSQNVYPSIQSQAELRDKISQLKVWLDRKVAVLRAFAAGNFWDQFLIADNDFDQYEHSFPDLARLHNSALQNSMDQHRKLGESYFSEREYGPAHRQFVMASMRQPSDKLLQQRAVASWANYSREVALDQQRDRKQLGVGEREILNQAIQFATNYKNENKLDLALRSITEAEAVDPYSLPMLLKKAEILGARSEFSKAFAALDQYDLRAVEEEREKASALRNDLLFKQKSTVEDVKDQIQKALADGQYVKVHDLAMKGMRASDQDPDLLYEAGTASIISRDTAQSKTLFERYLALTNTLDANQEQRAKVRALLAATTLASHEGSGERNWLSGKRLPAGIFYCPISLGFQPKIDHIEASGKMHVAYEWNQDQLVSITPTFEKAEKNTGERKINFVYNPKFPQVIAVSEGDAKPTLPNTDDPDDVLKHTALVVLNNPYLDPDAIQKLTGKNISIGVSGNRFFEPFVWDKVHYFRFTYDSFGRVARATELNDLNGAPTGITVDFDWDGQHLIGIHGYQGADLNRRASIYERSLDYQDGLLVGEEISGSGKSSRIKYNYNGGRMASAQCTSDPTLDDRSRQVTFR